MSAEEVSDNDCNDFDINYTNESNDETIDEIINQNIQQNSDKNKIENNSLKNPIENELNDKKDSDLKEMSSICEESDEEFDIRQQTDRSDDFSDTESLICKKQFICEYKGCDKRYNKKFHLTRHQLSHKGIQFKCDFENCSQSYSRKDRLKNHQKSVHNII